MLPILLDLKFIKLYTFGVFLMLAFFWTTFLIWRNIRLTSYKEQEVFDGFYFSLFGGFLVSRLIYVLSHFSKFGFDILKFILVNGYPGLSLIGFLIGFFFFFYLFCEWKKIKFSEIIDYLTSPILIGLGVGKIGAFFSGAEVGTKTKFPFALRYANFDGARHLTAFYEGLIFFIAAYICFRLLFQIRREKYIKGFTFYILGLCFALVYFVFDPLKTDKMLIFGKSLNGVLSLCLLLTFGLSVVYHLRVQIMNKFKTIINSFNTNAKNTITSVHRSATKKTRTRSSENSSTDPETKS